MENVFSRCGKSDNAPRLRFPEFRGKWIEKKLGEIFKKNTKNNQRNLQFCKKWTYSSKRIF